MARQPSAGRSTISAPRHIPPEAPISTTLTCFNSAVRDDADALPPLLAALGGARPVRPPVWFMRQAGRSLPEYRALRERGAQGAGMTGMLGACLDPATAAEATLQPVRRHGVDAAILFSDIMVPLALAGAGVRIEPGVGPVVENPIRTPADVAELTARSLGEAPNGPGGLAAIEEAARAVVAELGAPGRPGATGGLPERALAGLAHSCGAWGWTPLIGFGGAPFTLAAYLVEGRPSRDHLAARTLMHSDPASWDALLDWCARITGEFIALQIRAGASAAQLFDSWAGALSPKDYRERVAPHSARALEIAGRAISPTTGGHVPLIHFGTGTSRILADMRAAGADAVGVDDRTDLAWAIGELGGEGACPVQGNLDPALLAAPWAVLGPAVDACLEAGRAAPGHVLNLGHGVPPTTDPDVLTRIVARAHGDEEWEGTALAGWDGRVGTPGAPAPDTGGDRA
ncbi:uroporphyrinogen decarboxylase [Actinomyces marmotae]|uniref:uroporphyrinogen decarboxylase n=1 Tax=Actinomyces marmotae TaxID=2737173 RepID=A0A6M8B2S0_9ACTO|nr:uroporphyrinogen decarboxylase [Actinomyces marmotae]